MRLRELREEYPGMPESMRMMVEQTVREQLETEEAVNIESTREQRAKKSRTGGRMSWRKVAGITLAAAMLIGTTVFAGNRIYRWYTEKTGSYGLRAGVTTDEDSNGAFAVPEEIPVVSMKMNYLPEGMVSDGGDKYYFENTPHQGGISAFTVAMDEELNVDQLPVSDTYVVDSENLTVDGREIMYLQTQTVNGTGVGFDKKIYIAYPEYWQVVGMYVGEDVSKEEALKIAENLTLEPTGETLKLSEVSTWSEVMKAVMETEETERKLTATKEEMKNMHQIGDSYPISACVTTIDGTEPDFDGIAAKVTDVQIADDLSLLNKTYVDSYLTDAVGGDGKLVKNTIYYMKAGDGVDTLNEVTDTEEVGQKLVYVTVEYTNTSDKELKDILFFGAFVGMTEDGDGYTLYDRTAGRDGVDYVSASSVGGFGEMAYYDIHGGDRDNNYIPSMQPGETVTVHIAKIVNADELDKMYFMTSPYGDTYEFTDTSLEIGYVDIRQN